MFFAILETSLFVIGAISAWYILNQRYHGFFAKSLKVILVAIILVAPLQIAQGCWSGEQVRENQSSNLATIEARWESFPAGESVSSSLLALPNKDEEKNDYELNVPNGLGYILELKSQLSQPVQDLRECKPGDRPPMLGLIFYSFCIMVGIDLFYVGLFVWTVVQWIRGQLSELNITQQKWLLRSWILAAPLEYIAVEAGWIFREVGREPWAVHGLIRTSDATAIPVDNVLGSLISFTVVYTILFISALYFGSRIMREDPNLDLPAPRVENYPGLDRLDTTPDEVCP